MALKLGHKWRIALVVVLVLVGLYAAYRYTLHRMVEAKLDEIRKQGYPTTYRELDNKYPFPPAAENAATIYTQAFGELSERSAKNTNLPIVGMASLPQRSEPVSNEMRAAIEDYLSQHKEALALLHRGASYQKCRYDLGLSNIPYRTTQVFGPIRQGARLLLLESILRAENQEKELAVESILANLKLSKSLEFPPLLLSHLVRGACEGMIDYGLQRVLTRCPFEDQQLQLLSRSLLDNESTDAAAKCAVSERCSSVGLFTTMRSLDAIRRAGDWEQLVANMAFGEEKPPSYGWGFLYYRVSGSLDMDELAYLRFQDDYLSASQLPLAKRWPRIKQLEDQLKRFPRRYPYTRSIVFGWDREPSFGAPIKSDARRIAGLRNAAVACACERYRLHNDSLAENLTELVPTYLDEIPVDPFDGQPLRYKKLTKGYVVYSVGADGKDDGGAEPKHGYLPGTDVTFTVER